MNLFAIFLKKRWKKQDKKVLLGHKHLKYTDSTA